MAPSEIPSLATEVEFTSGSRKGCRATVTKRVPRHGYFVVTLTYAPRTSEYRKGESLHTVPGTSYRPVAG